VRDVFMITGGGSMYLNESLRSSGVRYICNHHEQASAMGAECYARVTGATGVVSVTTGPGAINALNGVFGAYTDSVPMLVISGQVKREVCAPLAGLPGLRQLGYQEANVIEMVRGVTKYSVLVDDPHSIRYHLERAWYLAAAGRPGPCWLDIPLDVQAAMVDEHELSGYDPAEDRQEFAPELVRAQCAEIVARLKDAERPVILAGTGVRCAQAIPEFQQLARRLGVPVTTAQTHDTFPSDDPLYCGRPGIFGQRAANFIVQNSDLLLVLGSSLHIRQIGFNYDDFAPRAFKIRVDIDALELAKPLAQIGLPVLCDLKIFLDELLRQIDDSGFDGMRYQDWLAWCRERVRRYPGVQRHHRSQSVPVNPYYFFERLFEELENDDVVVCGNGSAFIMPYQIGRLRDGQRLIANSGSASMGYDIPAAIGAAVARGGKRVICLTGDGSIQMNIQELQTLVHHHLPVKIFVLNNGGYRSIRATQDHFFGHTVGESPKTGVSFPELSRIAEAYRVAYASIASARDFARIGETLSRQGPTLCEVVVDPEQGYEPRVKSRESADGTIVSPGLEDMFPYLSKAELAENMAPSLVNVLRTAAQAD
jgi:acetolactate synthase-1/2/3 large subunit